jgi:hypothetical protein
LQILIYTLFYVYIYTCILNYIYTHLYDISLHILMKYTYII